MSFKRIGFCALLWTMLVEQWAFSATLVNSWPTHAADLQYLSLIHISLPKGSHFAVVLLGMVQGGRSLPGQPNLDKKMSLQQLHNNVNNVQPAFKIY